MIRNEVHEERIQEAFRRQSGAQALASADTSMPDIPIINEGNTDFPGELVAVHQPCSPASLNLRAVYQQLKQMSERPRLIAIAPVHPDESGSIVAANLAVISTQHGERTLLIDANSRNPRQRRMFNLTQIADRETDAVKLMPGNAVQVAGMRNLSIISAPAAQRGITELHPYWCASLHEKREQFDSTLIDCPSFMEGDEALALAGRTDGVVLILRRGQTQLRDIARIRDVLEVSRVRLLGKVLFSD